MEHRTRQDTSSHPTPHRRAGRVATIAVWLVALAFQLEKTIAKACAVQHDSACATRFGEQATRRALAIERVLWHPGGYDADDDWRLGQVRANKTAAMLAPLFVELAPTHRARSTLRVAEAALLEVGGLASTTRRSGQQWDAPNGWAPSQWMAVQAALHYGRPDLARAIAERFLGDVQALYASRRKRVEKYLVDGSGIGGGGGEYALQDGFGWTNGVTLKLLDLQRVTSAPHR